MRRLSDSVLKTKFYNDLKDTHEPSFQSCGIHNSFYFNLAKHMSERKIEYFRIFLLIEAFLADMRVTRTLLVFVVASLVQ